MFKYLKNYDTFEKFISFKFCLDTFNIINKETENDELFLLFYIKAIIHKSWIEQKS